MVADLSEHWGELSPQLHKRMDVDDGDDALRLRRHRNTVQLIQLILQHGSARELVDVAYVRRAIRDCAALMRYLLKHKVRRPHGRAILNHIVVL